MIVVVSDTCLSSFYYLVFSLCKMAIFFYIFSGSLTVIDENKYSGLACGLAFQCTKCGRKTEMCTSKKNKNVHEINVKANLAMAELEMGRQAMTTFSNIIGMPAPSSQSRWDKHSQNLSIALTSVVDDQLQLAA